MTKAEPYKPFIIGDSFFVIRFQESYAAYLDQFQIPHRGRVIQEIVYITVTEEKLFPGDNTGEEIAGYKAKDNKGRTFSCRASGNGGILWFNENCNKTTYDDAEYWDAVTAFKELWGYHRSPLVDKEGRKATLVLGVAYCEEHLFHHKDTERCLYCANDCGPRDPITFELKKKANASNPVK